MRFVRPGSAAQVMRTCVVAALSTACGRVFFDPSETDAGPGSDGALTCMLKQPVTHATSASPRSIAVGDVDRDGYLDLVTPSETGNVVSVLLGRGNGAFRSKTDSAIAATPFSIELADTNGDGNLDVIGATSAGATVLIGNGDGTFKPPANYATGGDARWVRAKDFTGDGRVDIVTANFGNGAGATVSVLLGVGDGTFGSRVDFPTGLGPRTIDVADLDRDGEQDLVVTNDGDASVSVLLGAGAATFMPKVDYVAAPLATSLGQVVARDLDGDGTPDLAVSNFLVSSASVLIGNGDGTFRAAVDYPIAGMRARSIAVIDADGDGALDLAVANDMTNTVTILDGNGDGTFGTRIDHPAGAGPYDIIAADVTGDSLPDLAIANYVSGAVTVLESTCDAR